MNDDWESKTVIGYKKRVAKVVKPGGREFNGTSPSLSPYTAGTDLVFRRKYSHPTPSFTPLTYTQAHRAGAIVAVEKKTPGNKANQGMSNLPRVITPNTSQFTLRN